MDNYQYQSAGNTPQMPVNDNMGLAITSLVLSVICCNIFSIIFGIIAIVKSNDAKKFQAMGQYELACKSGQRANLFSWIAIGLILAVILVQVYWIFFQGGMESYLELLDQKS